MGCIFKSCSLSCAFVRSSIRAHFNVLPCSEVSPLQDFPKFSGSPLGHPRFGGHSVIVCENRTLPAMLHSHFATPDCPQNGEPVEMSPSIPVALCLSSHLTNCSYYMPRDSCNSCQWQNIHLHLLTTEWCVHIGLQRKWKGPESK